MAIRFDSVGRRCTAHAAAPRDFPRGRVGGRRHAVGAELVKVRACHGAESARHAEHSRDDTLGATRFLRDVLLGRGGTGLTRPEQLRGGQLFLLLAYVRLANGQPALSVNWGSWSEVGMAAAVSEKHHRRWAALGLKLIEPQVGVQMLQQAVQGSASAQVLALPVMRSRLPTTVGPFFSELVSPPAGPVADMGSRGSDVLERFATLRGDERMVALVDFLAEQVIRVFALSRPQDRPAALAHGNGYGLAHGNGAG